MRGALFAAGFAVLWVGCGGLPAGDNAKLSSSYVGCPPDEIEISDERGHNIESWTATCRGRTYYCARGGGESYHCARAYRGEETSGGAAETASDAAPETPSGATASIDSG